MEDEIPKWKTRSRFQTTRQKEDVILPKDSAGLEPDIQELDTHCAFKARV